MMNLVAFHHHHQVAGSTTAIFWTFFWFTEVEIHTIWEIYMEPFEKQENNGNAVPILYQLIYIYTYIYYMYARA